jgi:hypothetical protein
VTVKTKARKVKVTTELMTKKDEDFFDEFVKEGGVKDNNVQVSTDTIK